MNDNNDNNDKNVKNCSAPASLEATKEAFIEKIIETLEKYGLPNNAVSLSYSEMEEMAHKRGLCFAAICQDLNENCGLKHERRGDKIIFSLNEEAALLMERLDMEALTKFDSSQMMEMAKAAGIGGDGLGGFPGMIDLGQKKH